MEIARLVFKNCSFALLGFLACNVHAQTSDFVPSMKTSSPKIKSLIVACSGAKSDPAIGWCLLHD
ncbi:hypothetical protein QN395_08795 [Undibacterium sp. RTI2.2]|uniref:hypothetical protein n=1 Tax=unclassified Undibacterium TaxID=2630295 RepID=UPI002AB48D77|nr:MULTISPECIES: hypothetical protein [unclassified Undibacterium]MDY7540475.1 hypothetical protein [Undibacterium sp. 5I1]MEB0116583.1 hypothetical protein [Undibacterium sp. RTI2.2]MEB0230064.1 hypothetical protein [Undibacterium sp. 10I3]MEB0257734.1 hypothetical protein [Undibacterium sp. 5I1]